MKNLSETVVYPTPEVVVTTMSGPIFALWTAFTLIARVHGNPVEIGDEAPFDDDRLIRLARLCGFPAYHRSYGLAPTMRRLISLGALSVDRSNPIKGEPPRFRVNWPEFWPYVGGAQ